MIIIGAGIAGLSTGCYGQMNGYRTRVFEMHNKPGGLCTAWSRRGYTFDGCIHHLAGAGPTSRYHRLWQELGSAHLEMAFHEVYVRCEVPDAGVLNVYTDIDRLAGHLKELAPEDTGLIDQFMGGVRRFSRFELLALPLYRPGEILRISPYLASLPGWMKVTLDTFASPFKSPLLRRSLPHTQYDIPGIPLGVLLGFLAGCRNRTIGSPRRGFAVLRPLHRAPLPAVGRRDTLPVQSGKGPGGGRPGGGDSPVRRQ